MDDRNYDDKFKKAVDCYPGVADDMAADGTTTAELVKEDDTLLNNNPRNNNLDE